MRNKSDGTSAPMPHANNAPQKRPATRGATTDHNASDTGAPPKHSTAAGTPLTSCQNTQIRIIATEGLGRLAGDDQGVPLGLPGAACA